MWRRSWRQFWKNKMRRQRHYRKLWTTKMEMGMRRVKTWAEDKDKKRKDCRTMKRKRDTCQPSTKERVRRKPPLHCQNPRKTQVSLRAPWGSSKLEDESSSNQLFTPQAQKTGPPLRKGKNASDRKGKMRHVASGNICSQWQWLFTHLKIFSCMRQVDLKSVLDFVHLGSSSERCNIREA